MDGVYLNKQKVQNKNDKSYMKTPTALWIFPIILALLLQ